jgi:cell division protein FtsN
MLTFGHFALPIAALIAVSLLFVGIKLFFLSPPAPKGSEVVSAASNQNITPPEAAIDANAQNTRPDAPREGTQAAAVNNTQASSVTEPLAGPWDPKNDKAPANADAKKPAGSASNANQQHMNPPAQQQSGVINTKPPQNTPADAKPPQGSAKPALPNGSWTVQIGAFSTAEAAAAEAARLKQNGYDAVISPADSSGKTFHRVRVARGTNKESAQKIADELSGKGFPVLLVPAK